MALAAREREKEREHPTASSVLLRPATRAVARSWSPHETNPTSGGRYGMEIPSPALASKPPTTTQGGIAPCAVRRQSVDDRQDNRELVRGIAKNYRDGEERVRHCPPDRTWSSAKSPEALPVETEQPPQQTCGVAQAVDEFPLCPGNDHTDQCGIAHCEDGEAETAGGHGPGEVPLRQHSPTQALPERDGEVCRPGIAQDRALPGPVLEDSPTDSCGAAHGAVGEGAADDETTS